MALNPTTRSLIVSKFPEYAATVDSLSALPGFDSVMQKGYEMATAYGGYGMNIGNVRGTGLGILKNGLKAASTDPVSFVKSAMRDAVYSGDTNLLKSEIQYLQKNNVPIDDIKNTYTTYATEKAQGQANYEAAIAAQSKGGGLFGDIGNFFASIDPSTAISKAATDLFSPVAQAATDLFQPVEKAASQTLSDFDKTVGISAVSREATQFAKDIGLTGAVKEVSDVVYGIGKAAEKDPLQYAAIIACIAAAPATGGASLKYIPYIQATAKVTSKQTSVEDVIKEGAKAYVISSIAAAGGDAVAGNTGQINAYGDYIPGTGVAGATNSTAVATAAGNISNNVIANAAKGGKATVADIVASGVSDAGLQYLAQTYTPDWTSLTPKQQAAAIDGVKLVLGDKTAASKLVNDALSTSIQAASTAALAVGYDNPWQKQAADEGGFTDAKTFKAADKLGITNVGEYQAVLEGWDNVAQKNEAATAGYTDPAKYDDYLTDKTANKKAVAEGWTNVAQKAEAAVAGYTDPIKYDDYLVDKTANEQAIADGWSGSTQKAEAASAGYTDPIQYRPYMANKQANDAAIKEGWDNLAQQQEATQYGYKTPAAYKEALGNYSTLNQKTAAEDGGFTNANTFKEADKLGFTNAAEYKAALDGDFKDAATYRDAKSLGTSNSADYRAIKEGGFTDVNELTAARKGNFTKASDYEAAQAVGIATLDNYQKFVKGAFTDVGMFNDASARGFTNVGDYAAARIAGWETKDEMDEASRLKIDDPVSYRLYKVDESAKLEGYASDAQRQAAQEGGFPNAATFKVADAAGFTNNDEFLKASTGGFNNATDYRDAKTLGIDSADLYTHYKGSGFPATLDYTNASAKGFYTKAEFDDATAKGYTDKTTYDKAEGLGFKNANDYSVATQNNIDAKTWNANNQKAVDEGWNHYADKVNAEKLGFDDPEMWKYANAVDLENQGSDITENYLASQLTQVGEDLFYLPENAGVYNKSTGEVTDFNGNKLPTDLFKGIISNINTVKDNPFLNRPQTTPTPKTTATDALSQAAQVIPDYLQDPSQIAKRKDRGTPYSVNPEWSVLNPQTPQGQQPQPQQKTQPLALPNPEVVQSGLFSGILSPYNPQNTQGGPYG